MMGFHPCAQVGAAQARAALPLRVGKVEPVYAQLVGHGHVTVIGNAPSYPVMPADGLHPPDLVEIGEGKTVHLVGAIALEQLAHAQHPFARRVDVGQDQRNEVLLAYTSRNVGHRASRARYRLRLYQRVCAKHAWVQRDGLRGIHGHVALVDASCRPDAIDAQGIGNAAVALGREVRKVYLQTTNHAAVACGLVFGKHDIHAFGGKLTVHLVLVAGDYGRAIVAGISTDKNGGARHGWCSSLTVFS